MWSSEAEVIVRNLMAELPPDLPEVTRSRAVKLGALPIGGDMWADYYLRPSGEIVVVGENLESPDEETVYSDRLRVIGILVWGSQRYPALRELLPERQRGATDCRCLQHPE